MIHTPRITVKLVHLKGPMEGEIQEFEDFHITIGRRPDAHVPFKLDTISRDHAEIIREGNRFKLIDKGKNPTLVDGKEIPEINVEGEIIREIYLRSGCVLTLADNQGPKISFLTETKDTGIADQPEKIERLSDNPPASPSAVPSFSPTPPQPLLTPKSPAPPAAAMAEITKTGDNKLPSSPRKKKMAISIQYGMGLADYELPVIIGRSPSCQCAINHPELMDQHLKVSYDNEQFIIEDLSGKSQIAIDGQFIQNRGVIQADQVLSLTPKGPKFDFHKGGRLIEKVEETVNETIEPPLTESILTDEQKKGKKRWPFWKK